MQKNKKLTLAIDSSGDTLKIALSDEKGKIKTASKKHIKQENYLFDMIEKLLGKSKLKDIKTVCVLKGPGRFTGIRIGITFASIMKRLNASKVFSTTTFEALAFQTAKNVHFKNWREKNPKGQIACVIHAFREEYFCQFFAAGKNIPPRPTAEAKWLSLEELKKHIGKTRFPLYLAGWAAKGQELSSILPGKFEFAPKNLSRLFPRALIEMARTLKFANDVPRPLYLKPAKFELLKK
jgi:tRNA threonylcarbamoyl adenosine modification protein YeaZ